MSIKKNSNPEEPKKSMKQIIGTDNYQNRYQNKTKEQEADEKEAEKEEPAGETGSKIKQQKTDTENRKPEDKDNKKITGISKKKGRIADREKTSAEYYQLKTQAVEDLVTADESNSPVISEEEFKRYGRRSRHRIADWVKILFIKAWFPGAACYFFIWGLGSYLKSQLDQVFVTAIGLGIITDLFTNNCIRFFEKSEGDFDEWMMIPEKKLSAYFMNIMYSFILVFFVFTLYEMINAALVKIFGIKKEMPLGVEPILFGIFYMGFDMLFITMRKVFRRILEEAKEKVEAGEGRTKRK